MLGRYHIDHYTIEMITWEPWLETTVSEIEDILTTKLLSHKRMPLQVPNGNCKFYLGDRCWRQLTGEARIPLDPPLSMSPHISPAALQEMRQAGFLNCEQFTIGEERETYASYCVEQTSEVGPLLIDSQKIGNINLFRPSTLRGGITPMVVTSASVHSFSQDFTLSGEPDGPDPGWHMEWTGRCEMLLIHHLRDPPPMSSSYGAEELWHLTHGMRRLALAEFVRDAQRLQQLTDENTTLRRRLDSV
ncbi:hypothetical protein GIB67_014585, partial [Kingdonia uniflora]